MADRYLIRDLSTPVGYVGIQLAMSYVYFRRVQVPENIQKKLAHTEKLKQEKTEAIAKKVEVCWLISGCSFIAII